MAGFKLGEIAIENRVICAPICGATKIPYRRLVKRYGSDLSYTEMIKAVALVRGTARSYELAEIKPDEHPIGAQICGAKPDEMAEAGRIMEGLGFDTIDINMGCPVPKVVREGAGAALMKDPKHVAAVVSSVAKAVSIPVTIKIRSGWTKNQVNALDVVKAAEQAGAQMVSIHGRARSQHHKGDIDYGTIAEVKNKVSIPVVGNGGIFKPEDAVRMVQETGCDAVMIARGGYGRPWFFRDCAFALRGDEVPDSPEIPELRQVIEEHFEGSLKVLGEGKGVRTFRKIASWYFKDMPFGTYFRDLAFRAKTKAELSDLIDAWIEHLIHCKAALAAGVGPEIPKILHSLFKGPQPEWMARPARQERAEVLWTGTCENLEKSQ